jgi:hypothetical protein
LLDLGLVRFVEAKPDVGYTAQRHAKRAMSRVELVNTLEGKPPPATEYTLVFYDPTPKGRAGIVRRPWLDN